MIDVPQIISTMTPFPFSIDIDAPLSAAIALMDEHDVHHLPVVEKHTVVGLVTLHDIRSRSSAQQSALSVRDLYIDDPYIVDVTAPLDEVLATLAERHISSAIITKHGKLVGILTPLDVCRTFASYLRERHGEGDGNSAA